MNNLLNNIQGWVHNGYAGNHLQAYVNTSVGTANTDLDDFVPQLWSEGINNYIEEQFVLANIVDTSLSSLVSKQGDVIHIPLMTEKTAQDTDPATFSAITDNLTYHSNNDDEKTITVNKLFYSAQIISYIASVQASLKCLSDGTVASEAAILFPSLSMIFVVAIGISLLSSFFVMRGYVFINLPSISPHSRAW